MRNKMKAVVLAAIVCAAVAARAEASHVAQIVTGDVTNLYETIAAAFAAARDGDTITMIDNATFTFATNVYVTVPEGRSLTFDLNGKMIISGATYNGASYLIFNRGALTIRDSAGKGSDGYFIGAIYHGANPTWIWDGSGDYWGSYDSTIVANAGNGSLTLEGGYLEMVSTGSAAYALENYSSETAMGGKVQIVINDGDVYSRGNTIRLYEAAAHNGTTELTVNGGYIFGPNAAVVIQAPSDASATAPNCNVTINGGSVCGEKYAFYDYSAGQLLTGNHYYLNGGFCYYGIYSYGSNVHVNGGLYYALLLCKDRYGANAIDVRAGFCDCYVQILPYLDTSDIRVVTGGLYACDQLWLGTEDEWHLSDYVEDGYVVCDNKDASTSEYYPFIVKDVVASIAVGSVTNCYGWLQDAFDAVSTDQVIDIWTNSAESVTVDKDLPFKVDPHGLELTGSVTIVRDDYVFVSNADGTCSYLKKIDDVPCDKADETTVVEAEKPAETKEEVWAKATNLVSTATATQAHVVVADSELTNAVRQAKEACEAGETVTKLMADVDVVVTPKSVTADANDKVRTVTLDVTPYLTTYAEVTDGETVTTNLVGEVLRPFAYSGQYLRLTFSVANLAAEPMLVIHHHDGEAQRYTRGDTATETTFAYDAEAGTVSLLMNQFSDIEIRSDIQVGADAWAMVDKNGLCTITGTGDMWNKGEWPSGANPLAAYRKMISDVVVESGVTSVGQAFFYKFYAVTNVTVAASVTNVADHAFYNCHSIQNIAFLGSTPTLGAQAIKYTAAIRMNGGVPEVYTIPDVTSASRKVWAKDKLTDAAWTDVTDKTDAERAAYHFFKVEMK